MTQAEPPVELLPWDSEFFNFRVARVVGAHLTPEQWKQVSSWCRTNGVRCLYYEADLSDFQSLATASSAGFLLADVRIVLERSMAAPIRQERVPRLDQVIVRPARPDELCTVEEIARGMGEVSRFAFDPHFPRGASGEMYAIWARKVYQSANGIVLVGLLENRVVGFVACERYRDIGRIALVGVCPSLQGRGIGAPIVWAALNWFHKQGCAVVQVVTQGRSIGAQRFYQKVGFRTVSVSLIYHRWFDEPGSE